MEYEPIICFETHVELKTETKLFCECPTSYGETPNSQICPVCTGQPGTLPVLNKKAVEYSIRAGLALNCDVNRLSRFARKNYFYPDLPKGYQISQYERPFCENGSLEIPGDDGGSRLVGIRRIHLEEDAGKLVHSAASAEASAFSLVDYNRAGVPLLEIVGDHTRNPIHTIGEARSYLGKLRQILKYIGVSDCIIENGQFRCDVNISLRPRGSDGFGNRTEIKNMASLKSIAEALQYETKRQSEILQSGGEVFQETRLFNEEQKITIPMRGKEDAPDYRYFPDPDLVEVEIDQEFLKEIETSMPELPDQRLNRIIRMYDISKNDAHILMKNKTVSDFFEKGAKFSRNPRRLSTWITKDLFRALSEAGLSLEEALVSPSDFSMLVNLVDSHEITDKTGRTVLDEMLKTGKNPDLIVREKNLISIRDTDLLEKIVGEVLSQHPMAVTQIKEGMTKPIDFLMGEVMKKAKGKAHPKKVRELLQKELAG